MLIISFNNCERAKNKTNIFFILNIDIKYHLTFILIIIIFFILNLKIKYYFKYKLYFVLWYKKEEELNLIEQNIIL